MCVFHNNMTAWLCAMGRGGEAESWENLDVPDSQFE